MENNDNIKMEVNLRKCWVSGTAGWIPRWNIANTQYCLKHFDHSKQPTADALGYTTEWKLIRFDEPANCELAPKYRRPEIPNEVTVTQTYKKCWCRDIESSEWRPRWYAINARRCIDKRNHSTAPCPDDAPTVCWDVVVFEKPNDGRKILE